MRKRALMLRIQMLHKHEGHAGVRRQMLQQILKRFKATRRCADSDDGKSGLETLIAGGRNTRAPLLRDDADPFRRGTYCERLLLSGKLHDMTHARCREGCPPSPGANRSQNAVTLFIPCRYS